MRDFFEHYIGAKQEIAAVPEETLRNVGAGLFGIRLFNESIDRKRRAAVEFRPRTDVAVAGRGVGRRDAERDDRARGSGFGSFPAGVFQRLGIAHDVIGGKDEHACLRPPPAAASSAATATAMAESRRDGSNTTSASTSHWRNCSAAIKRKSE